MKSKEQTLNLRLEKSGDDAQHEAIYGKYVMRKINEGIKAADDGRVISHSQVKTLFARKVHGD